MVGVSDRDTTSRRNGRLRIHCGDPNGSSRKEKKKKNEAMFQS